MSERNNDIRNGNGGGGRDEAAATEMGPVGALLASDQVGRWARVVAAGRIDALDRLGPADRACVEAEVRRLHRQSLISLIARAVAADIARSRGPEAERQES